MIINKLLPVFKFAFILLLASNSSCAQNSNKDKEEHHRPSVEQIFKDLDSDKDGKISKKEVKGPLKKHFDKADTNKDGYLTKKEVEDAPKPRRKD